MSASSNKIAPTSSASASSSGGGRGPQKTISKEASRQLPQRAAKSKFLTELATYRRMLNDYRVTYRRYALEKKTNPAAAPPKKPKIPLEYYQALTANDGDDEETSDEEFQAGSTSSEDNEDDDDDDEQGDDDDNE